MHKILIATAIGLAASLAFGQSAPYAGEQQREIKALSPTDVADLLGGQGMGLAKAAELNGYPGPAHVLENEQALQLTPAQRQATKTLLDRHKAQARLMGAALVAAERDLDQAFSSRQVDGTRLSHLTGEIGKLQAQLREEHLRTHLAQTALLNEHQVRQYAAIRGYQSSGHSQHR